MSINGENKNYKFSSIKKLYSDVLLIKTTIAINLCNHKNLLTF